MSSLKSRMAQKQLEQVEELVASTRPSSKKELARLEAERLAVEATLGQSPTDEDAPPAPEAVELEAPEMNTPSDGVQPDAEPLDSAENTRTESTPGAEQPVKTRTTDPSTLRGSAKERVPAPARPPKGKASESGEQLWRRFVTPPAARGTAINICRLNIPVTESTQLFLAQSDYELKRERSRWVVNRNELVTAAAEMFLADPHGWEAQYLAARQDDGPTPVVLQGRVTPELFDEIELARYTPNGKRPVAPVLSFIVKRLLGIPDRA